MAKHTSGRFAMGMSVAHIKSGDTISGGNYVQVAPDTDVFAGIENVTVTGGYPGTSGGPVLNSRGQCVGLLRGFALATPYAPFDSTTIFAPASAIRAARGTEKR